MSVSKFLGLDAPVKMDAKFDAEDVSFTIVLETPDSPRLIDASYDGFALEDPSLMDGGNDIPRQPTALLGMTMWHRLPLTGG